MSGRALWLGALRQRGWPGVVAAALLVAVGGWATGTTRIGLPLIDTEIPVPVLAAVTVGGFVAVPLADRWGTLSRTWQWAPAERLVSALASAVIALGVLLPAATRLDGSFSWPLMAAFVAVTVAVTTVVGEWAWAVGLGVVLFTYTVDYNSLAFPIVTTLERTSPASWVALALAVLLYAHVGPRVPDGM